MAAVIHLFEKKPILNADPSSERKLNAFKIKCLLLLVNAAF